MRVPGAAAYAPLDDKGIRGRKEWLRVPNEDIENSMETYVSLGGVLVELME